MLVSCCDFWLIISIGEHLPLNVFNIEMFLRRKFFYIIFIIIITTNISCHQIKKSVYVLPIYNTFFFNLMATDICSYNNSK